MARHLRRVGARPRCDVLQQPDDPAGKQGLLRALALKAVHVTCGTGRAGASHPAHACDRAGARWRRCLTAAGAAGAAGRAGATCACLCPTREWQSAAAEGGTAVRVSAPSETIGALQASARWPRCAMPPGPGAGFTRNTEAGGKAHGLPCRLGWAGCRTSHAERRSRRCQRRQGREKIDHEGAVPHVEERGLPAICSSGWRLKDFLFFPLAL